MPTTPRTNPIDVLLDADGDLPAEPVIGKGIEVTMQRVATRLQTHKGDWPLQSRQGVPYVDFIQQKPAQVAVIGAFIRREIEGTPGVVRVDQWSEAFDGEAQTLVFSAEVYCTDGVASITVLPPGIEGNVSILVNITSRSRMIA